MLQRWRQWRPSQRHTYFLFSCCSSSKSRRRQLVEKALPMSGTVPLRPTCFVCLLVITSAFYSLTMTLACHLLWVVCPPFCFFFYFCLTFGLTFLISCQALILSTWHFSVNKDLQLFTHSMPCCFALGSDKPSCDQHKKVLMYHFTNDSPLKWV